MPKLKASVPLMTAATDAPAMEARNLYRFYQAGEEETLALRGVSLTVGPGTDLPFPPSVALFGMRPTRFLSQEEGDIYDH